MLHLQLSSTVCEPLCLKLRIACPCKDSLSFFFFLTKSQNGKERERVKRQEEEDWRERESGLAGICEVWWKTEREEDPSGVCQHAKG